MLFTQWLKSYLVWFLGYETATKSWDFNGLVLYLLIIYRYLQIFYQKCTLAFNSNSFFMELSDSTNIGTRTYTGHMALMGYLIVFSIVPFLKNFLVGYYCSYCNSLVGSIVLLLQVPHNLWCTCTRTWRKCSVMWTGSIGSLLWIDYS